MRRTEPADPRHPVIVGAHELSIRSLDAEPVAMMAEATRRALADASADLVPRVDAIRVVKGIWPYRDPGRLVADLVGLPTTATTAITGMGGNATYDLVAHTAADIVAGQLDVVVVCGAESMRTRRADRAAGRLSTYLAEPEEAAPDVVIAGDDQMTDEHDAEAKMDHPVNFYAMADSVIRNRLSETPDEHLRRISRLWSEGSAVAAANPNAWMTTAVSAEQIATPGPQNRPVAAPYTKLLTSNINVDQGAALVLCAFEVARELGVDHESMVFLEAAAGASDHLPLRTRAALDRSPAFRLSAVRALELAGRSLDDVDHLDLYSCFPASVQLARRELGLGTDRPFTITGGLTFAGGPFNGYCTQALAHATSLLRATDESAFLYGNGGYFSKHSVLTVSGVPPRREFTHARLDDAVRALPKRQAIATATSGDLEAYTVTYGRDGRAERAILSVLDASGGRFWASTTDTTMIRALLETDLVGRRLRLDQNADAFPEAEFM